MTRRKILENGPPRTELFQSTQTIPFLGGRPERVFVIGNDDLVNLKIALHMSESLEEFFAQV